MAALELCEFGLIVVKPCTQVGWLYLKRRCLMPPSLSLYPYGAFVCPSCLVCFSLRNVCGMLLRVAQSPLATCLQVFIHQQQQRRRQQRHVGSLLTHTAAWTRCHHAGDL